MRRNLLDDGNEEKFTIAASVMGLALVALIGVAAFGIVAASCYPRPPVNPPSCAQDPTQEWCVPPAFAKAPDGGAGRDGGPR